jgi:hypothetical protein
VQGVSLIIDGVTNIAQDENVWGEPHSGDPQNVNLAANWNWRGVLMVVTTEPKPDAC